MLSLQGSGGCVKEEKEEQIKDSAMAESTGHNRLDGEDSEGEESRMTSRLQAYMTGKIMMSLRAMGKS